MRHGIEDYLASDEVRAAIRAYGLPIAPGESGDLVVERMVAFLNQGVMERYGR